MSKLIPLTFDGVAVRIVKIDGKPWFVGKDVAKVLEIGRTDDAVRRLDDDEKGTDAIRTPGGPQEMTVVNEFGLYSLIFTSRKPSAKRFRKWVTAQVLPSIRKTGRYDTGDSRKEASVGFQMMCEALQSSRIASGKDAKPHHYINEARLINAALTGAFQGIERSRLVKSDLDLLIRLEHENEFLRRQAKPYAERKAFLILYAEQRRQRLASKAAAKPARKTVTEMSRYA